ncbi:hypothetical protein ACT91Q_10835 [Brevibacillus thermoruber]|jgi:hypothetical protein|uniref:hypothetical protein n=1 Tax=Brevibacillus thermoruber TaxID=33942 RepID=UPI004042327D
MIVKETAEVRKQINNYKRFLEKPELFNHAALVNDQFYYNVQYWRIGKKEAVGYLILRSDGSVPPRSEALPVVERFMVHNNSVTNFLTSFAIDKEKPVWMYEQKRDYLRQLLPYCEPIMDVQTRKDAHDLIEVCEYMIEGQDKLREMYDTGLRYHKEMVARNYVVEEDVKLIREILYESDFLMYQGVRMQVDVQDAVDRLYAWFQSMERNLGEQRKTVKKLLHLLGDYKRSGVRRTMEKSVRDMEIKGVSYRNVEEMKQAFDEKNKEILQDKIFSILRNP